MAKKKKSKLSPFSKIVYLIITLIFFILANMYLTDLIIDEIDLGLRFRNPVIALHYVQNTGAAFSILENYPYALIILGVVALIFVLAYTVNNIKSISLLGVFFFSLLISGIFCNLYERVFFGYVRDFLEFTFVDFPIFNFSDIYINISVIALIILLFNKNVLKNV